MAEAIGVASGVVALATFALQSTNILMQAVKGFKDQPTTVRKLEEELEALHTVLDNLYQTIEKTGFDFEILKCPLERCGKSCVEFKAVLDKCTSHSGKSEPSIRDWIKLRYMGDDINKFRDSLTSYKSTITIALGDMVIRTTAVTAGVLKDYKQMIKETTSDLKMQLEEINEKLSPSSFPQGVTRAQTNNLDFQQIEEERASIQQCLVICNSVSTLIQRVQANKLGGNAVSLQQEANQQNTKERYGTAQEITNNGLEICRRGINATTSELNVRLNNLNDSTRLQQHNEDSDQTSEIQTLKAEQDSIQQCIDICTEAKKEAERVNVFEDVSMEDEGHQIIVSTLGDLISAKRITVGSRSAQWLGQMSDAALQQLSRDRHHREVDVDVKDKQTNNVEFVGRYGTGRKMS